MGDGENFLWFKRGRPTHRAPIRYELSDDTSSSDTTASDTASEGSFSGTEDDGSYDRELGVGHDPKDNMRDKIRDDVKDNVEDDVKEGIKLENRDHQTPEGLDVKAALHPANFLELIVDEKPPFGREDCRALGIPYRMGCRSEYEQKLKTRDFKGRYAPALYSRYPSRMDEKKFLMDLPPDFNVEDDLKEGIKLENRDHQTGEGLDVKAALHPANFLEVIVDEKPPFGREDCRALGIPYRMGCRSEYEQKLKTRDFKGRYAPALYSRYPSRIDEIKFLMDLPPGVKINYFPECLSDKDSCEKDCAVTFPNKVVTLTQPETLDTAGPCFRSKRVVHEAFQFLERQDVLRDQSRYPAPLRDKMLLSQQMTKISRSEWKNFESTATGPIVFTEPTKKGLSMDKECEFRCGARRTPGLTWRHKQCLL